MERCRWRRMMWWNLWRRMITVGGWSRSHHVSRTKCVRSHLGWWLVKKGAQEGWAPSNYLELIPPKPKPAPPPPAATPARRAPPPAPTPVSAPTPVAVPKPKPIVSSLVADSNAKPVSVFPGMGGANGGVPPWKKAQQAKLDDSDSSAPPSRPNSSVAGGKPPVPAKPKPPVVAPKPGAPKPPVVPGRPVVPTAKVGGGAPPQPPRPAVGGGLGRGGPGAPGQMDLAAAVSRVIQASSVAMLTKIL